MTLLCDYDIFGLAIVKVDLNMDCRLSLYIFFLLFSFPGFLFSQDTSSLHKIKTCVEKHYFGTDDLLVNGRNYLPYNTRANGHPYYSVMEFQDGTLFMRDRKFAPVSLRYNVERDQLILKHPLTNGNKVQVIVTPELVDSFHIEDALFIHIKNIPGIKDGPPFFKKIYGDKTHLYETTRKRFLPIYNQVSPHGKYSKPERKHYIVDSKGGVVLINNKRDFLSHFGGHKKEIKRFIKKEKFRFGKASDAQFAKLMKFCDELEIK